MTKALKHATQRDLERYEKALNKVNNQLVLSDHRYGGGVRFKDEFELLDFILKFNQKG